jgi:hypothetical protein
MFSLKVLSTMRMERGSMELWVTWLVVVLVALSVRMKGRG